MDTDDVERLIENAIPDADATVTLPRVHHDEEAEDAHYAAVVVSPAFEGKPLVQQHQLVYDALEGHVTRDIHAMEIKTFTPAEYEERAGGDDPDGQHAGGDGKRAGGDGQRAGGDDPDAMGGEDEVDRTDEAADDGSQRT